jgi:hypothetical protein
MVNKTKIPWQAACSYSYIFLNISHLLFRKCKTNVPQFTPYQWAYTVTWGLKPEKLGEKKRPLLGNEVFSVRSVRILYSESSQKKLGVQNVRELRLWEIVKVSPAREIRSGWTTEREDFVGSRNVPTVSADKLIRISVCCSEKLSAWISDGAIIIYSYYLGVQLIKLSIQ